MERISKYVIAGLVLVSIYFGNLKYNLNKIESLKVDLRSTRETIIKEDAEYYSTKDKEFIIQDGKIRVPFPLGNFLRGEEARQRERELEGKIKSHERRAFIVF